MLSYQDPNYSKIIGNQEMDHDIGTFGQWYDILTVRCVEKMAAPEGLFCTLVGGETRSCSFNVNYVRLLTDMAYYMVIAYSTRGVPCKYFSMCVWLEHTNVATI